MSENTDSNTPKRIVLRSPFGQKEEAQAGGAITPGDLIALNSDGDFIRHGTAGGDTEVIFAEEDALQGNTIYDDYAADDRVFGHVAQRGDIVYARLHVGEVAVIGSQLSSNGDGTLQVKTGTEKSLAVALEAVDLNDTGDETTRIRVRIL